MLEQHVLLSRGVNRDGFKWLNKFGDRQWLSNSGDIINYHCHSGILSLLVLI